MLHLKALDAKKDLNDNPDRFTMNPPAPIGCRLVSGDPSGWRDAQVRAGGETRSGIYGLTLSRLSRPCGIWGDSKTASLTLKRWAIIEVSLRDSAAQPPQ